MERPTAADPWFHGSISRVDAESLLRNEGDYLVRESTSQRGNFVLVVRYAGSNRHVLIQTWPETGRYYVDGDDFRTVEDLIDHHRSCCDPVFKRDGVIITQPVIRSEKWELDHSDVSLGKQIGSGNFGDVFMGELLNRNHMKVAIKTCKTGRMDIAKFLEEAEVLKQYLHKNIVSLIGICAKNKPIYIVMEYLENGDLHNFLHKFDISKKILVMMASDVAAGMSYLEQMKCIHRDLAARNCLVNRNNIVKIADFGLSRMLEDNDHVYMSSQRQIPIKWTAPEALLDRIYSHKSDVWAYGILLWELFSGGEVPYPSMNNVATRDAIASGYRMPAPKGTPNDVYDFMCECWSMQPEARPPFVSIYKHIKKISNLMPDEIEEEEEYFGMCNQNEVDL